MYIEVQDSRETVWVSICDCDPRLLSWLPQYSPQRASDSQAKPLMLRLVFSSLSSYCNRYFDGAREFRERCLKDKSGKTLATPDAIHLATAIICKGDAFITFDDGGKSKKHLGLLGLNKDSRIDGLQITRPEIVNPPVETQEPLF